MNDYDFSDETCPKCGQEPTHYRHCGNCEDGFIDVYDEDPLWYDPGEQEMCRVCWGTGIEKWCPKCNTDLSKIHYGEQVKRERAARALAQEAKP